MKIWHISDTHGYHDLLGVPEGIDMVIHSGDCANYRDVVRNLNEVWNFIEWYSSLDIPTKVFVGGNHDTSIEERLVIPQDFSTYGITYIENETIELNGLRIFGSPLTPTFGNWSWNKSREKLERIWRKIIEEDTDIVITHGPPKGILDLALDRVGNLERCGDKSLLNRVMEVNPKLCLFGHIHDSRDIINQGTMKLSHLHTIFSNGSVMKDGSFGRLTSNGNILEI
jgi:Icc-related predicted phosphoesterase